MPERAGRSTVEGIREQTGAGAIWTRRAALVVLALVLVAALFGLLGLHTSTARETSDGYSLDVSYPRIARAGLDVVWTVTVHHRGGFGKSVDLRITGDYSDFLETQGYSPQPSSETEDGQYHYMSFSPPPGDTFKLDVDAYVQPASQEGRRAEIAVLVHGVPVVEVAYCTHLVP